MEKQFKRRHLSTFQIIILSFLLLILLGCFLLMLPWSTREPGGASWDEALFTATSAVCVTGLVVQNTATYWSTFGQSVILCLIQVGGMGVVTIAVFLTMISGKKISLMQRSTMQEAIAAPKVGGIVKLTGFILKTTCCIELLGAMALAVVFVPQYGFFRGIWYSVFHAISAFCNAGFDLLGTETPYVSLTEYVGNPVINITIMLLIIIGGIGFLTWEDIRTNKLRISKYRMQSKVILLVTALLILLPAIFFYVFELGTPQWNQLTQDERAFGAIFQSVTTRTAGFNTLDLAKMSEVGQTIMVLLMLIGGSPGSTAGGMKTTTIAVLLATLIAVFRRREDAHCFRRRIEGDTVKYAATILMMYVVLLLIGGLTISMLEGIPVVSAFFESASALGTVGLTLGITPDLGMVSRMILVVLMYLGRVGGLTLVFAAVHGTIKTNSKLPQEKITVG